MLEKPQRTETTSLQFLGEDQLFTAPSRTHVFREGLTQPGKHMNSILRAETMWPQRTPAQGQEGAAWATGLPARSGLTFCALCLAALWWQLGVLLLILGVGFLRGLLLHTATSLLQEGCPCRPLPW